MSLTFWATSLIIPILLIVANATIRWGFKLEPSSFADVLLMFVVFDALVIAEHKHIAQFIQNDILKADLIGIYLILLISNMILWVPAVFHVEKKLSQAYDNENKRYKNLPWRHLAQSWGLTSFVFFANLSSFAYRG